MSLRDCSDAELAFEFTLRAKLSDISNYARCFDDYLDGTLPINPDSWTAIQCDVFDALAECCLELKRIRKSIPEGAYD